jgi:hypothetical protein
MITGVLTMEDMNDQGGTLVTFIWLAVLFGMSGQLNEMGFMGYVGRAAGGRASKVSPGRLPTSRCW